MQRLGLYLGGDGVDLHDPCRLDRQPGAARCHVEARRHRHVEVRDLPKRPEARIVRLDAADSRHALVLRKGVAHQRDRRRSQAVVAEAGGEVAQIETVVAPGLDAIVRRIRRRAEVVREAEVPGAPEVVREGEIFPGADGGSAGQVDLPGVEGATGDAGTRERGRPGPPGHHVHHATRPRLREAERGGSAVDLDVIDGIERQVVQVHHLVLRPAERHAVEVDLDLSRSRAADGDRAEVPQAAEASDLHADGFGQRFPERLDAARRRAGVDHRGERGRVPARLWLALARSRDDDLTQVLVCRASDGEPAHDEE